MEKIKWTDWITNEEELWKENLIENSSSEKSELEVKRPEKEKYNDKLLKKKELEGKGAEYRRFEEIKYWCFWNGSWKWKYNG